MRETSDRDSIFDLMGKRETRPKVKKPNGIYQGALKKVERIKPKAMSATLAKVKTFCLIVLEGSTTAGSLIDGVITFMNRL